MKFRLVADIEFEAEDITDAMEKLSKHFAAPDMDYNDYFVGSELGELEFTGEIHLGKV